MQLGYFDFYCISIMIIFGLAFCFIMPTLIVCVIEEYTESKNGDLRRPA
mgnify:CR=1 FL=1